MLAEPPVVMVTHLGRKRVSAAPEWLSCRGVFVRWAVCMSLGQLLRVWGSGLRAGLVSLCVGHAAQKESGHVGPPC